MTERAPDPEPDPNPITPANAVVTIVVGFLLALYLAFAKGFVTAKIWLWFFVPLGAPPVTWSVATAAVLAYSVFVNRVGDTPRKEWRAPGRRAYSLFLQLLAPWATLFIAWIIR